ncbi:2-isopropylmalate synthase [Anaeromassilibacillus sp. An172]|uniref:2-isopropylmalate synthase n=1 Tax=Anaeromassilibacillus sp. An172 TaxID=1965570 RepID=UPI000B371287|nr:2-isopropylmalate synthase [Anaeromassilibacillus sp. An172]OUP76944.1 2-isopropylmalate synthase [Anaeromassilibacillus sp. An172]
MKNSFHKYIPFQQINLPDRQWPNKVIEKAPIWCSVDLRDGNQALIDPMNLQEKLEFFHALCDMGFKEIEIGFPSASETEYEICRELIEGNHIPDDVTIQVLVQAREHLIRKTFEAIEGAKNVIVHFYNSTSTLQRKVVFKTDMDGVIDIAVKGAKLVKELTEQYQGDTNIRFEYSPESFSGTEMDNAVEICARVMEELGATKENPVILNLPNTVEMCTANTYADQIEYFIKHLPNREAAIISIHPHNDRGCGVAASELALLAGAERVEGTLFGNGERTGNLDIVTMGLNMYTQGVDPELDFSNLPKYKEIYERCTGMKINERQPYIGELVFTAFSGSHQDAINKGMKYMKDTDSDYWEVPYLPIDPADVGRQYEPIIRINSQSGKGGAAFVMNHNFGFDLPKKMHPEFGALVQAECERVERELTSKELYKVFEDNYINHKKKYDLLEHKLYDENGDKVTFTGTIRMDNIEGHDIAITGTGNGPIDAFFNALKGVGINNYEFMSYSQHAISSGSDSKAVSYIQLKTPRGNDIFGVGIDHNVNFASILGVLNAINRSEV